MQRLIQFAVMMCLGVGIVMAADAERGESRPIPLLQTPPVIDGTLDEWDDVPWFRIASDRPSQLHPKDLSATVCMGWDATHLYLAVWVKDDTLLNDNPPEKIRNGDVLQWFIGAKPATQGDGFGDSDFRLYLAPTTSAGAPASLWGTKAATTVVADQDDPSGIRWAIAPVDGGYTLEVAVPFAAMGRATVEAGDQLSHVLCFFDRDDATRDEWKQWHTRVESSSQKHPPKRWPLLTLVETTPKPAVSAAKAAETAPFETLSVSIPRHKPSNLFEAGKVVTFDLQVKTGLTGDGTAAIRLIDYSGKTVTRSDLPFTVAAKTPVAVPLDLGALPNGYYTLIVDATVDNNAGTKAAGNARATLGVVPFSYRTAQEVREGDYRFGLKMWYLGEAWWHGNATWDEREITDATCKLGLQWTRAMLHHTFDLPTTELVGDFPMNCIMKVERFPRELYDADTYGPMDEWEKQNGRGVWVVKTLPQKEPYKAWLRDELKKLPPEQNVFEVWNEAWDKMSAEDLATISGWIVDVILDERPDAIIGPNLRGDTSTYQYDAAYIRAGGMRGMKMVALHPYSGSENRQWLRDYKQWLKEQTGRDIDIYVTEYGSHSTPAGPAKRSETEQAQRVVRQSLALYAEDVKALTPHWMGQREHNPTYHEDWFGFFRLNHEVKPVVIATATCARMIDSKRYVGDLWFGEGVGAMLFEKEGEYTLALWTKEGEKSIELQPGVDRVTVVDMVGAEREATVAGGKLPLTVGMDLTYVVGVSPSLEKLATTDLRDDRWPQEEATARNKRVARRFAKPPTLDGKLGEWTDMTQLAMVNPKVNGKDASGIAYLAWDEHDLYIALDMRDDQIMNTQPRATLYREDSMELFISTEPRENNSGYGPNDFQFFVTPVSGDGVPVLGYVADGSAGVIEDVPGARYHIGPTKTGWAAEIAIPWEYLGKFAAKPGAIAAMELRVNDADKSHKRWKIDPSDGSVKYSDPTIWSLLELQD